MKYHNDTIRRQNRLLDEASAIRLLREGEYGFLAMQAEQGGGYGIPLSYVWNGTDSIYLHGAPEGRKLRCLDLCDRITFCIVGHTRLLPGQFSTEYESILLTGTACTDLDTEEKNESTGTDRRQIRSPAQRKRNEICLFFCFRTDDHSPRHQCVVGQMQTCIQTGR